jgi:uncharacterized protein DUF6788
LAPLAAQPSYARLPPTPRGGPRRIPGHPTYVPRLLPRRLKKLATTSPVLAASFGRYTHRCGRPECRCHHGGPLHCGQHLTFKDNGKTRSVSVPKDLLPEARTGLAEHQRLKALPHEIHHLSVALLRARARLRKLKAAELRIGLDSSEGCGRQVFSGSGSVWHRCSPRAAPARRGPGCAPGRVAPGAPRRRPG